MKLGAALVVVVRVEVVLVVRVLVDEEVGGAGMEVLLVVVVPGGAGVSSQRPKADWHPAPQYSGPEPHQKKREQQGPQPASAMPGQIVELPHWPLVVIMPVGMGMKEVELVLLLVEVLLVVLVVVVVGRVEVVDVLVEVGLAVVEVVVVATGRGHPQTPYAG